jgi:hypothetical protein
VSDIRWLFSLMAGTAIAVYSLGSGARACADATTFGADPSGVADSSSAWGKMVVSGATCFYFPAGRYKFLSTLNYKFAAGVRAMSVIGDGIDVTELTWPDPVGAGISIGFADPGFSDSFHVRDLTLSTGSDVVDVGLMVSSLHASPGPSVVASGQAQSDITRVTFRSSGGYADEESVNTTHGWGGGVVLRGPSLVQFSEVTVYGPTSRTFDSYGGQSSGNGIVLSGGNRYTAPVVFNFSGCNFQWLANGILIESYVQGVNVDQSNFTGNAAGIGVPGGETGLDQLTVTGSQFNNVNGILVLSPLPGLTSTNNLFLGMDSGLRVFNAR